MKQKKPLVIIVSGAWKGLRGRDNGGSVNMYNISLIRIVTIDTTLHKDYILRKKLYKKHEVF
jgi:hypothetical protein